MPRRKLINRIKAFHLPYHIDESTDSKQVLPVDENVLKHFKEYNLPKGTNETSIAALTDASPDLQLTDRTNRSKPTDTASLSYISKRSSSFFIRGPTKDYFPKGPPPMPSIKAKIKSASVERVEVKELSYFYRFKYTAKVAKKTVLNFLPNISLNNF